VHPIRLLLCGGAARRGRGACFGSPAGGGELASQPEAGSFRVASGAIVRYGFPMRKARVPFALAVTGALAAVVAAQSCQEQCEDNLQFCVDACLDYSHDVDNCGACSAFCSFAETCSDNNCQLVSFASDAGDGGTLGVAEECATCARLVLFPANANCTAALVACKADPDCDIWSLCASACFTSGFTADCFNACAGTYADGGDPTLLAPVLACICIDCPDLCVPLCPLTLEGLQPANVLSTVDAASYPPLPSKP
jgi:hypothetical protein